MSENPEEQPSTGVLGRIGSWFSPWRGKGPKGPSENASAASDQAVKLEGEKESEGSVRLQAREQQGEEEKKEERSNPSPLGLSRDIFPSKEEDATQSTHRHSFVLSSTETADSGPREEEFVRSSKKRIVQGKEREESSNGISVSGNPERNASHLTLLSSSSEQGVVKDSDWAHTQPRGKRQAQAQTGKRLHVYLEETSVIKCGQDARTRQEIVRTEVTKNLQVLQKAKSSPNLYLPKSLSSTSAENKGTNVRSEKESNNSAQGVSLTSRKDSQFEPEPGKEQTQADSMGRKNASRRKIRKNPQVEGGTSPQEKMSPSAESVPDGFSASENSVTSPRGKSPKSNSGKSSSVNSSSEHNPTSQTSPEGESKTSCPDSVKPLVNFHDSNSVTEAGLACVVDGTADMEDDDSLYKVERKTETPESKRRSIKVSHSEVKVFPKNVPLNPKPAGNTQDFKLILNTTKNEAADAPKTETDARLQDLKKINEEPKKVAGRIADRISLFERPAGGIRKTLQTPRSANVSPARNAMERLIVNMSSEQRSRSAERYDTASSSSASPSMEKPMSIQERARIFTEATKTNNKATLSTKSAMTGMSQKCTSSIAVTPSKSPELDSQGKLDTSEHIQTNAVPEVTLKPDGRDTTDGKVEISIPKEQPTDVKIKDTLTSKTTDQGTKPNNVESNVPAQAAGESAELSENINQQSKGPSRTSSRSKRRKSKEPSSPISPSSEKKADSLADKLEVTAISQDQVDNTEEMASASRQPTEKDSLSSVKATGHASDEQPLLDIKEKGSKKEPKVVDKQKKQLDLSQKKKIVDKPLNRQEPEPSVNKDEPDTAACSRGTKKPIDKDAVILSQKKEKTEGQSLLFTQEKKEASKDSKETPASPASPAAEQPIQKQAKQELPVKNPKLDKDFLMQSEPKNKGKIREPGKTDSGQTQQPKQKDKEGINQAESKDDEKLEKSKKTNLTEMKNKETPELHPDQNAKKVTVSDSGTEGNVAMEDGRKGNKKQEKTGSVKDKRKPESSRAEPALESSEKTSSDLSAQTQHNQQTTSTRTMNNDAVFAVNQTNGEVVNETKSEKEPPNGEPAKSVFTGLQTKCAESPGTETASVVVAAEPQPVSVFVEKTENPPDDSCAHGANDVELSGAKPITKATVPVEKVAVKATNDTAALITAKTDRISEKDSSVKEPTQSPVSKSEKSEGVGQGNENNSSTVKSVPSEDKISGDNRKITSDHPPFESSKITENTSNVAPFKAAEKIAKQPANGSTSSSTVTVAEKKAEKDLHPPKHDLSPVANGDLSPPSRLHAVQKEPVNNKPSQTPKAPASPKANKLLQDSIQRSPMKKLSFPRGLSKDDSATLQDAPSSWLDVDFPKKKLKVPVPKLSSAVSESNLLDTSGELDDEDFIERIKKLCAPFSLPPRKHSLLRPPQPPFAMPAIKEDHFEKTFDPEEFKFGLRKEKFSMDTTTSFLAKLQAKEVKSGLKPARASLADRSMLLSSLDIHSRLKDKTSDNKDEEDAKEEKDDQIKVKSRLEGSCVFSSLNSSKFRGKKNGAQTQAEGTNSEEVSPSEAPQASPPPLSQRTPPTSNHAATAPLKETLAKQSPAPNNREEVQAAEVVVSDSAPPLPSFNDIKLPDYLEKYFPRDPAKPVQSVQAQEQGKSEVTEKMTPPQPANENEAGLAAKPGPVHPNGVPPSFPGIPPTTQPTLPELKKPPTQPQGTFSKTIRTAKGFHKRPGKLLLFERAPFGGQAYEIHRDVADATSMQFSPLISVKVVRGCWVLYEKPDFLGRCIALDEGVSELTNEWAEPGPETEPQSNPPVLIGSIRLAVSDYSIPRIDLFTEPEGLGRVTPYHDDTIETGSFGIPLSTASIQVHSGVWLVFSDPGFQGMLTVLETGVYPFPETWGFPSPFVGSLRPLKMGGLKVENPNEVKALVYEKPGFEGSCLEIDSDVFIFCENEGGISADGANLDSKKPKSVGSLKIIGGLWVGYSEPGFEGQQHILEEGEYLDCSSWGGTEQLMSLRPIIADYLSPHLKMFSDRDFGELGVNIDLSVPVINMDDTGYGTKTQSLHVIGGVWVVFEEQGFCGEPYILEKGLYGSPEDWGALRPRVASAMPVVLDDFENASKFKVQLFSEPGFQGSVVALEDSVGSLQDGFSVASCKVLAGNWLAFEGQGFTGRMYVLELGNYSDMRAMGCFHAGSSILSLQTVGFEFSLPSITLFERCGLRGKRVILTDGSVNLQLAGGCSRVQSVLVEGGMWVLYEEINYRGAQILLKPGEVLEWRKFSNWTKIGSLRPLIQKQVHFRVRNRQTGLMMSVTGDLDDVKLMRIQETEENDGLEQIWFYHDGHLHCKLLEECCLNPSGSVTMAGSRIGLIPPTENQAHLWSITPEGFIRYTPTPDLVLEVKGGHHYDKNQVILNTLDPNKLHQRWNVEVI